MQKTQGTPQPQDPQTHNPQNNSSSDNTYESTPVSSTVPADNNQLVIDEDEQDEHNVKKDIFRDHTDDSSEKATDNADDSTTEMMKMTLTWTILKLLTNLARTMILLLINSRQEGTIKNFVFCIKSLVTNYVLVIFDY